MRSAARLCSLAVAAGLCTAAASARGQGENDGEPVDRETEEALEVEAEAQEEAARAHDDEPFEERFLVDVGRFDPPTPSEERMSFSMHGEYQMRVKAFTDLLLQPPLGVAPGTGRDLGSNYYLHHWLRVRPLFQYKKKLKLVGEMDIPFGMFAGQSPEIVEEARDSYVERRGYDVHPRKLYLEYLTPIGLVRAGHQASHWGMGLLANDGDHPSLFGDYRRGAIVERILFATRPLGAEHPFAIALAADFVFEDNTADVIDEGDRAMQAVLAIRWDTPRADIGIYGVYRHHERDRQATGELTPFTEVLNAGVVDLAGGFRVAAPVPDTFVFGEIEAAVIGGKTTFVRNVNLTAAGDTETVLSFGGAARLGAVRVARADDGKRWGVVAVSVEAGYASGDADPYDGTTRRFTIDQNHNVGLVLFDHVLAWKTARAATIAGDPNITARPAPGVQFLPSEGGIFGASYLNPTLVVRPRHWFDLKTGVVIAQTTADLVDPFHAGALGNYANYDGGDETAHDLGIEIDFGAEGRIPIAQAIVINLGAEGGVLFPGGAFDDSDSNPLPKQYLLNGKLGVNY